MNHPFVPMKATILSATFLMLLVDYYDWLGRRYHIGAYGQRIYQ